MNVKVTDKIATIIFYTIAIVITLILVGLLSFILVKGLSGISWGFLTKPPENMKAGGGVGPQIFNSFFLLFLTMLFTVPVGIGGGIYMAEYSKPNIVTNIARLVIEVLSSLPSIVVGLFGLLIFVQKMGMGFSLFSGALALMIFNLPLMVRITEQSLRAVPVEQKEASLAMGISHWKTIVSIMLPIALPGIITGTILTAGRAFGEAAALMFTAGMSSPPLDFTNWNPLSANSPINPFRPAATLAVHIWKVNSEGLTPDAKQIAASASAVLITCVLFFNLLSRLVGKLIYKKFTAA
ncbi:MAG: phosphate transport system permease protein [Clostridiales bacterium]|jgi:phosphate transport system permease protein|uniref:phosphate ABC transporter permease PstA n=1 Tax=Petroclostridium xylanilyticum TaxID=1792311 RepID=UPI000B980528|nr:phosphate ABC transporter permease PstA [Petroclostridium xylanilyticum]MBZ4645723.1 pstA [Clostridia bacterium]MDK2809681.1 phosphate transport system permease protein [Petroclostridium sp.]MDK2932674.1 phosphate transport system permease protein [Clostridiales bacterium]